MAYAPCCLRREGREGREGGRERLKSCYLLCAYLQPIPRQYVPGPKDIKVLCADDVSTALSWTAGIRLAKYGLQLRDNYHKAKLTQFKLEDLGAPEGSKPKADVRERHFCC